ncbi:EAL domain-containing protein [Geodermatophilus chilensis]|uniref:EAL domain-containing protein n=1 Tax=Geodermatophilus chilensis TaxID=2035835 RepID=UPI000C257055|nr:EAL domain-containing protein [Geodermatophilus chilensis]
MRHLPAHELELDRSLTLHVGRDPRATAIVRRPVALARDLGRTLVAACVEDPGTATALAALGCDTTRGYAIARPMPVEDLLTRLTRPASPLQPL